MCFFYYYYYSNSSEYASVNVGNNDLITDTCCLNCSFAGTFLFCGLINDMFSRIVDVAFPLFFRYRILGRIMRLGGGECSGKRLGNVIIISLRINILSL